jgi:hypothetical protein
MIHPELFRVFPLATVIAPAAHSSNGTHDASLTFSYP